MLVYKPLQILFTEPIRGKDIFSVLAEILGKGVGFILLDGLIERVVFWEL